MEAKYYQKQHSCEGSHWWYLGRRQVIEKILECFTGGRSDRVLEVGCGSGGSLELLSGFGHELTGVELEPSAAEDARQRGIGNVVLGKLGDPLPEFEQQYGLVAMFDVLEHIEDDAQALQHTRQLVGSDGHLVITVPAYQFLWSVHDKVAHHYRRYSRRRLTELFEANGFKVEYCSYFNTLLFPAAMLTLLASRFFAMSPDRAMRQPSGWINRLLARVFSLEARMLPRRLLPFGLSLVLVASVR